VTEEIELILDHGISPPPAPEPERKRKPILFGLGLTLVIAGGLMLAYHGIGFLMIGVTEGVGSALSDSDLIVQVAAAMSEQLDSLVGAELREEIDRISAALQRARLIADLASAALAVLAIVAAVGLMKQTRTGRKLAIAWGAAAVAYLIVDTIVFVAYLTPLMEAQSELMAEWSAVMSGSLTGSSKLGEMQSQLLEDVSGMTAIARHAMSVVMAILPVLTLILVNRKRVREALA